MMSNLVEHAKAELLRAGLFDEDSDYGGMLGGAVMELVDVFAAQGHSGMSAYITLKIFATVASFEALTPLTDDPGEWNHVTTDERGDLWQSRRESEAFSYDHGKTYYLLSTGKDKFYGTISHGE